MFKSALLRKIESQELEAKDLFQHVREIVIVLNGWIEGQEILKLDDHFQARQFMKYQKHKKEQAEFKKLKNKKRPNRDHNGFDDENIDSDGASPEKSKKEEESAPESKSQ